MKILKLDAASSAAFFLYAASAVITPVSLLKIAGEFSINFTASGGIEAARTVVILLVLMVSGFIAGRKGKKILLTSGLFIMATGMLSFAISHSYLQILLSMMLIGMGGGLTEALVNPLVKDTHPQNPGKYLNITNAFYSAGITISVLGFGALLSAGISWRLLFVLTGIASVSVGLLFLSAKFPVSLDTIEGKHSFGDILKLKKFWYFGFAIFFAGGLEASFIFWLSQYVHIYFSDLIKIGTIATALFGGTMASGRLITGRLTSSFPLKTIIFISSLMGLIVSLFIFHISDIVYFLIIVSIAGFATASLWPSILAEASRELETGSTILFVVLAGLGILGYGLAPFFIGIAGDFFGLRYGFIIVPIWYTLLLTVILAGFRSF